MDAMGKLIEDGMKSGSLISTEGCLPSAKGARVRLSGGKYTVTDGPFTDLSGKIEEVNDQRERLHVLISIFGRDTPVELAFNQVEKM